MRILFTIIAFLLLLSADQKKITQRKIIDVHFHAHTSTDYGKTLPANPITGKNPVWKDDKDVIDQMLTTLKANNVVKVIATGSLATIKEFQLVDPGTFIPALNYPDAQNNELPDTTSFIRLFQEKKFSVFGELGLKYEGKTLADPELEPYLAICESLAIPIALHTGMG